MLMLSSALKGIRSCCEMMSQGKAEIQRIKKGVADAKEIVKEVSGFFGWIKSLFEAKPSIESVPVKSEKKVKDEYVDYIPDQDAIIDQFINIILGFLIGTAVNSLIRFFYGSSNKSQEAVDQKQKEQKE